MEADIAFRDDVDDVKADMVDGAIGEGSEFHSTFSYYAQGVSVRRVRAGIHRRAGEAGRA